MEKDPCRNNSHTPENLRLVHDSDTHLALSSIIDVGNDDLLDAGSKHLHGRRLSGPSSCLAKIAEVRPRANSEPMKTYGSIDHLSRESCLALMAAVNARPFTEGTLDEKQWLLSSYQFPATTLRSPLPIIEETGVTGVLVRSEDCMLEEPEDSIITSKELLTSMSGLHELPSKQGTKLARFFWSTFSMYKKIFALVLFANIIAAISAPSTSIITHEDAATAAAINLCATILFRNEHFINAMFRLACSLQPSCPLWFRRIAAKVYSYGCLHSSCATAGSVWYLVSTLLLISDYHGPFKWVMLVLAISVSVLLWIIVWVAFPRFRMAHHNTFEGVHRFCGWMAVAILWAQLSVAASARVLVTDEELCFILAQMPLFWCLDIITVAIIYPWSRSRLRNVHVEVLSPRAALLYFDYDRMDPCLGIRITDSLFKETHSFATISKPGDEPGFRVLMSRAGDWTSNFIDNPPTTVWVRGAPTIGVMRVALMFRKVLVVSTGSGIGPCLSLLESCPEQLMHVLWMTSDPRESYGNSIINAVYTADPGACIVDTSRAGRGDILNLAYSRFVESESEAVVIISNPAVTGYVVEGLETRSVPVFGAIFDS